MKILYINNFFSLFGESDCGASTRSTMFISALAEVAHVDIISFRGSLEIPISNCCAIYAKEITTKTKESRLDKFLKLIACGNPIKIYPINVEKEKIVDQYFMSGEYDYIACRYLREATECGILKYSDKLILDIDDNPKDIALMASKTAKTLRNRIYNRLFAFSINSVVKSSLKKVFCCFHSNPLQPPVDKSIYLHNLSISNIELPLINEETPMRVIMVGAFSYGPNIEGLEYFLEHVWPIVHKKNPNIILNVVGRISNANHKERWSKIEGVSIKGFVPNLIAEYKESRVVIVPIYSGTGTSVKLVEAMNLNRVCVSTQEGVRGYDQYLKNIEDYLLAKTDEEFANNILTLIDDVELCNKIATSAKNKIEKYYSQHKFNEIVKKSVIH